MNEGVFLPNGILPEWQEREIFERTFSRSHKEGCGNMCLICCLSDAGAGMVGTFYRL